MCECMEGEADAGACVLSKRGRLVDGNRHFTVMI